MDNQKVPCPAKSGVLCPASCHFLVLRVANPVKVFEPAELTVLDSNIALKFNHAQAFPRQSRTTAHKNEPITRVQKLDLATSDLIDFLLTFILGKVKLSMFFAN